MQIIWKAELYVHVQMLNFPKLFRFRVSCIVFFIVEKRERNIRRGGMYYFKFQMLCALFRNDELNSDLHKLFSFFFFLRNSTIYIALTNYKLSKIIREKKIIHTQITHILIDITIKYGKICTIQN